MIPDIIVPYHKTLPVFGSGPVSSGDSDGVVEFLRFRGDVSPEEIEGALEDVDVIRIFRRECRLHPRFRQIPRHIYRENIK